MAIKSIIINPVIPDFLKIPPIEIHLGLYLMHTRYFRASALSDMTIKSICIGPEIRVFFKRQTAAKNKHRKKKWPKTGKKTPNFYDYLYGDTCFTGNKLDSLSVFHRFYWRSGTYGVKLGFPSVSYCKRCPTGYYCPPGTVYPNRIKTQKPPTQRPTRRPTRGPTRRPTRG